MSSSFPSKTLATLFIMAIQLIAVNSSVFSPPTIDFILLHDLRRSDINLINTTITLTVDESWRSWILTNASVTDSQFQHSLSTDLSSIERAPHHLVHEILHQFPSIILSGDYVRNTVLLNNEKSLTGSTQLDFFLNAANHLEEKLNIGTVAGAIKEFSKSNGLFAASPLCVLDTVDGCQKVQIAVCAKAKLAVDGTALEDCDDATDDNIKVHVVLGPLEVDAFASNVLTLQKDGGISTVHFEDVM